jgi:hypothetical protein
MQLMYDAIYAIGQATDPDPNRLFARGARRGLEPVEVLEWLFQVFLIWLRNQFLTLS